MRRLTSGLNRWAVGAACIAATLAAAAPAMADPPWGRGWRGHHHRWGPPPPHYHPPPVRYYPPPVYYAPPPVYYAPPPAYVAPGLSFGLNIPLR